MRKDYLSQKKSFYKSNLHCHSNYSDGALSPQRLKEIYKEKGYSVLAITDHDGIFDHSYLNDEEFITLPAYEMEINDSGASVWNDVVTCHLCIYPKDKNNVNCVCFNPDFVHPRFKWMHNPELKAKVKYIGEPYVPEYTVQSINHIISEANKNGFLVTLNHIQWSQESYEQYSKYEGMFAMEIYNTSCERMGNNEYNSAIYDLMLHSGHKINCVAADDNHNGHPLESPHSDSFGGWVMINADVLEHGVLMSALERGEFYSSTGPEIKELYIEDGKIHIKTSPAKKIRLLTGNRFSAVKIAGNDGFVDEAVWDTNEIVKYFRIEVTDSSGEKAYTNAYFEF